MSMSPKPADAPTSLTDGGKQSAATPKNFVAMVLDMGWQLAIAVLAPMLAGVYIGTVTHAQTLFVLLGFAAAMVLSALVIRRFYRLANSVPVAKLTPAQKERLEKLNREDDADD